MRAACQAVQCHNMCVCVCVCDTQIFQIMHNLRGSTMIRPNHEFFCSVALSPGFRNWVETRNMQQEGVGLVFLPRLASLVRAPVFPCVEAPLGESVVLLADTGGEKPTGAAVLLADAGGEKPTGTAGAHVLGRGERGWVATGLARRMNPGSVPTGIRTHDLWRGRQVRFRYTISRCGCIPAFITTRCDFHRLCLGAPPFSHRSHDSDRLRDGRPVAACLPPPPPKEM